MDNSKAKTDTANTSYFVLDNDQNIQQIVTLKYFQYN